MSNHRKFASNTIAKLSCGALSYCAATATGTRCCSGVAGVWQRQLAGTLRCCAADMLLAVEVVEEAMIDVVEFLIVCLICVGCWYVE